MVIQGEIATTQLMERVLLACAAYGITFRKRHLAALRAGDFGPTTVPLFVRCDAPVLESWIDLLVRAGRPYLYYIDDNFWRIEGDSPIARHYRHPLIRRSLEHAVTNAFGVLTNSQDLASFLARFSARVQMLPTFFDFALTAGALPQETDEVRVGFAGSPSRADDLELIRPLLAPILAAHPQLVFEFAGAMPAGVLPSGRIRFFPHLSDYAGYLRFQIERNWTIGLAPLRDTEANRCKTENKYREYGACGVAGIYSDIAPYRRCVVHGENGWLVSNTPAAWRDELTLRLANRRSPLEAARRARADVFARYRVEIVAERWAQCLHQTVQRDGLPAMRPLGALAGRARVRRMRLGFDLLRMQMADAYHQGKMPLVVKKSVKRLARLALPGRRTVKD